MNVDQVRQDFLHMQSIFRLAAYLQLTADFWPKPHHLNIDSDEIVYDYIIVGGGTAGCVLATRLLEIKGVTILLIEAGGNPPWEASIPKHFTYLKRTPYDWNITTDNDQENQNGGYAEIPQGKMLGGTSSLNFMFYEHGNSVEYTTWASIVNSTSWLYDELLPFYKRNEKLIDKLILSSPISKYLYGTKGRIKLSRFYYPKTKRYMMAHEELGIHHVVNINSRNPLGITNALYNAGRKTRQSTAYSFLRHVKNNKRLHVMTNTLVTEIILDFHNVAKGVKVRTQETTLNIMSKLEVILAAGVFKTPQLLMLSGIGPKRHLNKVGINVRINLPVGENLHDAPTVLSVFKMGTHEDQTKNSSDPYWIGYPVLNSAVAEHVHESFPDYTVRSYVIDNPKTFLTLCAITFNYKKEICEKLNRNVAGKDIYVTLNSLAYPRSRGSVTLVSKNISIAPRVRLNLYSNNEDLEAHALFLKHYHTILYTSHFEKVSAVFMDPHLSNCEMDMQNLDFWRCYAQSMASTSYNYFGTCAMGSVVDTNLNVIGVTKLRVIDASVIPTSITSPILPTVVMLAEKGADMIKKSFSVQR